jgi:hypothetical protein
MPGEAWGVIGLAIGALSQYLIARSTNAATITQQARQGDREDVTLLLSMKEAETIRLRDDLTAERARTAAEQARADRYLALLLEDERTMHAAAAAIEQTGSGTGGAL